MPGGSHQRLDSLLARGPANSSVTVTSRYCNYATKRKDDYNNTLRRRATKRAVTGASSVWARLVVGVFGGVDGDANDFSDGHLLVGATMTASILLTDVTDCTSFGRDA